ncbi:MAG: transporter [Deltaproteobacteria bacterium]
MVLAFFTLIQTSWAEDIPAAAQESDADLAQELSNPLADLMSIPFQMNYDHDIGPSDDGWKLQTNIQPVIPFHLNEDWNLITRTIVPLTHQEDIFPGAGSQFGLGDINLSLFFSPKKPTSGGVTWGVGPVLLFPTATDDLLGGEKWGAGPAAVALTTDSLLGAKKWGAGPAAVALTTRGPWTVGILANHLWSYGGDSDRQDISTTFVQPFAAYTWPNAWTVSVLTESSYNWKSEKWSVPINAAVSKLVKLGRLPVSLQAGVGYWAESPETGPEGVRFRLQATFVLPKLF